MKAISCKLHSERPISGHDVRNLYDHVDWWPNRSVDDIELVLEQGPAVGAWDGDRLVGFARAVSDGSFRAYIEDVVVDKQYRRLGIADHLLSRLLRELDHIETISLFCDPEIAALYEAQGFERLGRPEVVLHRPREGARGH